jgi:hypothetical protein
MRKLFAGLPRMVVAAVYLAKLHERVKVDLMVVPFRHIHTGPFRF